MDVKVCSERIEMVMGTAVQQQRNDHLRPWKMLALLVGLQVLVAFVGRSLAPLGPLIGVDLSLTKAQIGLMPAALFVGQSIIALPAGFVTDKIGTKWMLLIAAACLGGSFIVMTYVSVYAGMLLMIVLGGVGYGASHPAANRGILYWFEAKKRGTAMGIKQMGITAGSALSALLLLPLANVWGWRPAVILASVLLVMVGGLVFWLFREPAGAAEVDAAAEPARFFSGLAEMAKNGALLLISFAAMLLSGSQMIFNTYIVLFAYEFLGIGLISAGLLLVIAEVGGSFGRIIWGLVSDRLFGGKRIVIILIISVLVAGMGVLFAFLPAGISFWTMAPLTFVFGFCVSGFNGIWMNAATELVPFRQSGIATGFSLTIGAFGVMVAPPVFGHLVDTTGAYTVGWLFVAGMMGVVMVLLMGAMRVVKRRG